MRCLVGQIAKATGGAHEHAAHQAVAHAVTVLLLGHQDMLAERVVGSDRTQCAVGRFEVRHGRLDVGGIDVRSAGQRIFVDRQSSGDEVAGSTCRNLRGNRLRGRVVDRPRGIVRGTVWRRRVEKAFKRCAAALIGNLGLAVPSGWRCVFGGGIAGIDDDRATGCTVRARRCIGDAVACGRSVLAGLLHVVQAVDGELRAGGLDDCLRGLGNGADLLVQAAGDRGDLRVDVILIRSLQRRGRIARKHQRPGHRVPRFEHVRLGREVGGRAGDGGRDGCVDVGLRDGLHGHAGRQHRTPDCADHDRAG